MKHANIEPYKANKGTKYLRVLVGIKYSRETLENNRREQKVKYPTCS